MEPEKQTKLNPLKQPVMDMSSSTIISEPPVEKKIRRRRKEKSSTGMCIKHGEILVEFK
jgi:hypothetical protein